MWHKTALDAAVGAARWIEQSAIETEAGVRFPSVPDDPTDAAVAFDLYSGSSGIVVFLAELARETKDATWHDLLKRATNQLEVDSREVETAGLYDGLAGVGAALLIAADATHAAQDTHDAQRTERYRERVSSILAELAQRFNDRGDQPGWNDSTDIVSGTAGIGLFLIEAHQQLAHDGALELAQRAGEELMAQATTEPEGLSWAMTPDFPRRMPNFSHGTAGVATFLARLGLATGDDTFVEAAIAGARHLLSLAETEGDTCLIYHHSPGGESLYYMSWCHGPPGTARLFRTLADATGEAEWSRWVERSAQAILSSDLPEVRSAGFWNNVGLCCGNGGVLDFLLSMYRASSPPTQSMQGSGDERYLLHARRLARHTLDHATLKGDGLEWSHAEHRVRPDEIAAQTGLMQGAAGIGLGFLRLAQVEKGRDRAYRLPDDPFESSTP